MNYRVLSQAQFVTQGKLFLYIHIPLLPSSLYYKFLTSIYFPSSYPYSFLTAFISLNYHHTSPHLSINFN